MRKAVELFPLRFDMRRGLADTYLRFGPSNDLNQTLADVNIMLVHDPNSDEIKAVRIVLYNMMGQPGKAWQELSEVSRKKPNSIPVRWAIGLLTPVPVAGATQ